MNGAWAMIYGLNKAYEVNQHRSWWEIAITIAGLTLFLIVVGSMAVFLIFCTAYLRAQFHGGAIALRLLEWLVLTGALSLLVCRALPLCTQSSRLRVALERTRRILCSRSMDRLDGRYPALLRARKQLLPQFWPLERRGHAPAVALRQQRGYSHRRRNELGDRKEYSGGSTRPNPAPSKWIVRELGKRSGRPRLRLRLEAIPRLKLAAVNRGFLLFHASTDGAGGPAQRGVGPGGNTMGAPSSSASRLTPSWVGGRVKLSVSAKDHRVQFAHLGTDGGVINLSLHQEGSRV